MKIKYWIFSRLEILTVLLIISDLDFNWCFTEFSLYSRFKDTDKVEQYIHNGY